MGHLPTHLPTLKLWVTGCRPVFACGPPDEWQSLSAVEGIQGNVLWEEKALNCLEPGKASQRINIPGISDHQRSWDWRCGQEQGGDGQQPFDHPILV